MIRRKWFSRAEAVRHERTRHKPFNPSLPLRPVAANSPVPRYAPIAQSSRTENRGVVMKLMEENATFLSAKLGKMFTMSYAKVLKLTAKFTASGSAMPLRTLREQIAVLVEQHELIAWEVKSGCDTKRTRHDGLGVMCFRIPTWSEILSRRLKDPSIGKTSSGKMYVIGKEKRFLTQPELDSWKIEESVVESLGSRAQSLGEAAPGHPPEIQPAAEVTNRPPPDTGPAMKEPEIPAAVLREMNQRTSGGITADIALKFVRTVRARASELRLNLIPNAAQMVYIIVNIHQASGKKLVPNGMYFVSARDRIDKCLKDFEETGGVCPTCRGAQRVENVVRGIGAGMKPCPDCTGQTRMAG